jgi:transcriptional regulator with XRE-family HTH domain
VSEKEKVNPDIGLRLRAVMHHFNLGTNEQLAKVCGAEKSAVNNWLLGGNYPRVPKMVRLCKEYDLTLDWIYCVSNRGMNPDLAQSLDRAVREVSSGSVQRRTRRLPPRRGRVDSSRGEIAAQHSTTWSNDGKLKL